MARKYVRFNYFEVQLVPADLAVRAELNPEDGVINHGADLWNMQPFLDYLMVNAETFRTTVPVGDEYAEIEKDTYTFDERRNIYSFQLSKLRENNIPSKKRFGEIKENILLEQDEYIGEFISFIYDNQLNTAIVQSNLYGLTIAQTENVLTQLRFRYLDTLGNTEDIPLIVKLVPVIDGSKVRRLMEADFYKKIRIKCADVMLDAGLEENSLISETRRLLGESAGVIAELTISLGRSEKTASLDEDVIRRTLRDFEQTGERNRPTIELTALQNEEAEVETVNLIEPRLSDRISIEVRPRQTVAHEYLYQSFIETYDRRRGDVRRVLRR
ncbi:DUF6731 family protein [Bacillus licheniformis]|uniref:DUF6731 family protein n=1 Tax=Bacillus TaxID=1386 RepID=UPI002DB6E54B|nr:DUF6731 family protein [Bacillus licheniformis]MEC0715372.1 hypothetical protein [Bacillus licheniformis]